MTGKQWTNQEISYLRDNYRSLTTEELSNILGRDIKYVIKKANRLGLLRRNIWTKEEDAIILEHFEYAPQNMLLSLIPNRTWSGITQRGLLTHKLYRKTQDRYNINYKFFSRWSPESAYVYGFILADGYLRYKQGSNRETSLQFELADYDNDILEQIKTVMNYQGSIKYSKRNTARLSINNTKIAEDLIELGIPTKDKTHNASWPASVPDKLKYHLLRGLLDGDGSVLDMGSRLAFQLLGTKQLLEKVVSEIGNIPMNIHHRKVYGNNNGADVYVIRTSGKNAKTLFERIYKNSTIRGRRKYERYQEILFNKPIV